VTFLAYVLAYLACVVIAELVLDEDWCEEVMNGRGAKHVMAWAWPFTLLVELVVWLLVLPQVLAELLRQLWRQVL
jgi:uncharacterized YccA/Bax inhibitor family protein